MNNTFKDKGYTFGQVVSKELLTKVFKFRYKIYTMEYGFEPTNPQEQEEDQWDKNSVHFACLDKNKDVIGTARCIHEINGLPVHEFMDKYSDFSLGSYTCFELSRFSVAKEFRKTQIPKHILKALFRYCDDNSVNGLLFMTEQAIIDLYIEIGFNIKILGPDVFMHGRDRQPCLLTGWKGVL